MAAFFSSKMLLVLQLRDKLEAYPSTLRMLLHLISMFDICANGSQKNIKF